MNLVEISENIAKKLSGMKRIKAHIHVIPIPKKAPEITGATHSVLLAVQANQNNEI